MTVGVLRPQAIDRPLIELLASIHARPGGTGAILNLVRSSKVRAASDAIVLTELVHEAALQADLARHASDEARHACLLLERMLQIGFQPFRIPEHLDRLEGLFIRSRAREPRHVYADRGFVNEAELMELLVAASIAKEESCRKLRANCEALAADGTTRRLLADILGDEERHVAYIGQWLERFERRFSRRALERARQRLLEVFRDLDGQYYGGLESYLARPAA